ncbi:MAG: S8 family serine peptidase [Candidatus Aminicenantes bacterium]|nr:S8 family serine peptidase [Candidatus Aminicenantes bacterium]
MKIKNLFLLGLAGIFFFWAAERPRNSQDSRSREIAPPGASACFVPGQLVVKLASDAKTTAAANDLLSNRYGGQIQSLRREKYSGYLLVETTPGTDLAGFKKSLAAEKWVQDVSFNYLASMNAQIPNEQFFSYQYALLNNGQVFYPEKNLRGTSAADIKATEGWTWSTGSSGIIIAIIDTGIAVGHEDLKNKIVPGYDFVNDDADAQDDNGHGTLVASLAAAETNNGIGIAGVGWNASLLPVKVLDSQGNGNYLAIAAGIKYAADHGAKVLNLSLGGNSDSFILKDACQYAFDKGCSLVAAAGDSGSNAVQFPAAYDLLCTAVGASDANDKLASFSNRGLQIDVVAPGVWVYGAAFDPARPTELRFYNWGNGTSLAAAHVSGAIALLISYKPLLTNLQVMAIIKYTADDVNASDKPGVDTDMGYGRINLQTLLSPYNLN